MKKYDGSLYDILEVTKGNVKSSLELILPVIRALYTLSEGNPPLYHRDIKPDNILFLRKDDGYTLYLTDFGTCFLNDGSERLTPETMAVGPRMYIAPEYETGRVDEVTEKGDIFSIGKVIWCMINGEPDDFMPSNFWFVDEYDLSKRFPDNADMIVANTIIASCLNIAPDERCTYSNLIGQIENFLTGGKMTPEEEAQYRVGVYQEKRRMELIEIKEKNRLIVNCFSQYYVQALEELLKTYPDFRFIDIKLSCREQMLQKLMDYDPAKGAEYATYIYPFIRDAMLRFRIGEEKWSVSSLTNYKMVRSMAWLYHNTKDAVSEFAKKYNCDLDLAEEYLKVVRGIRNQQPFYVTDEDGEETGEDVALDDTWNYTDILWNGIQAESSGHLRS